MRSVHWRAKAVENSDISGARWRWLQGQEMSWSNAALSAFWVREKKILRESPYSLPFDCCKSALTVYQDVFVSAGMMWNSPNNSTDHSVCVERECGNACKDSHVVNRLCLSRSYLSVHAASAHISSFTSSGPAYKPETWVWNGTKPLDFHFHLDRMYMSGQHVLLRTQRSENKSHLEYAAASRVLYNLDFINSVL